VTPRLLVRATSINIFMILHNLFKEISQKP
jgi:hypothetical protein